jgi:NAD(P)-dependent dehydrogenase (short-subunit alcohol dehydrogenase family)
MTLLNKTIVITGACSGIGADFAKLARLQGARVIGVDRNEPTLTLDGFVKADLGDAKAIDARSRNCPSASTRSPTSPACPAPRRSTWWRA